MAVTLDDKLVVAISSRALFNFEEENRVFEHERDDRAYVDLQRQRLDVPAAPGVAFSLVRKLLAFNTSEHQRVEVVLLSRNDPVSGMRVFRSCNAHGLPTIQRGVFTQGRDPFRYLRPLGAHLFLSANEADVREALHLGYPAARAITESVQAGAATGMRIRTALVAARSAAAHERAIRTLMDWNIDVDEAMFLGGLPKGEFLREFEPDFFFDDQTGHVTSAARHVPAGHVNSGISNPLRPAGG